jgi:hypothetical protein
MSATGRLKLCNRRPIGSLATMSGLHRLRLPLALRVFVLALLAFGLLMKPVLAVACEIDDARQGLAGQHQPLVAADPGTGGEDCCLVQNCNQCCVHTVAVLPPLKVAASFFAVASPLPALSVEFEPTAYPVALRPPIAG